MIVTALWWALACATPESSAPSSAPAAAAPADDGDFANVGVARVTEALAGDGRSYLRIEEAGYDFWVSVPRLEVKVGDAVLLGRGPLQADVASAELRRTFPAITVIERVRVASAAEAGAVLAPPEGGVSLADLYARRTELAGKPVKVRGRVVKANLGIFGKNWYHLRDGTGTDGSDDLTVNGAAELAVGDVVVAEGTLTTDKDYGFGYFFAAIVEDATLVREGGPAGAAPAASASPEAPVAPAPAPAADPAAPPASAAEPPAPVAAPATAAAPAVPAAPGSTGPSFLGVRPGFTSQPELDAWLSGNRLVCTTAPAPRRATTRTTCETDLPIALLEGRTVSGKWTQLLYSRADDGPIHYVATSRRYSIPSDAALDFRSTRATLARTFGEPGRERPVEDDKLDGKMVRFSAEWTLPGLEVKLSVLRAGTPWVTVNETWAVPGAEAGMPARAGTDGHFGGSARPPGWNPHVTGA